MVMQPSEASGASDDATMRFVPPSRAPDSPIKGYCAGEEGRLINGSSGVGEEGPSETSRSASPEAAASRSEASLDGPGPTAAGPASGTLLAAAQKSDHASCEASLAAPGSGPLRTSGTVALGSEDHAGMDVAKGGWGSAVVACASPWKLYGRAEAWIRMMAGAVGGKFLVALVVNFHVIHFVGTIALL